MRFNERHRLAIRTIRENLELTGLDQKAEVHRMDAFALLRREPDRQFDYVYIAPPQYKDLWKKALLSVDTNSGWLVEDAWVIVQIHPLEFEPVNLENLVEFDQRKYGSTLLVFYAM